MTFDKPSVDNAKGKRVNGVNRRCKDFHRRYLALCRSKNFQPLAELISGTTADRRRKTEPLHIPALNFYGDRFKECDWLLMIDALTEDTSLEMLAIRLRKVLCDGKKTDKFISNKCDTYTNSKLVNDFSFGQRLL